MLAGITNGFVPVPIPPYCSLVPPLPLHLTHWSSVLYFFFKDDCLFVWFIFLVVVFISAVEKEKKNVRKFKYLKMFQGKRGFCYYSNILLCTYCKYETLLFCKPRTHFVLLLYINKVYWLKKQQQKARCEWVLLFCRLVCSCSAFAAGNTWL